jgi:hypothetical protein
MVEVDDSHAEDGLLHLLIALLVLVHYFLQQEGLPLEFLVSRGDEGVAVGQAVLWGRFVCLN